MVIKGVSAVLCIDQDDLECECGICRLQKQHYAS